LVGLLGISPSFLVSAAADSTLRVWDIDTGELRHVLAAHTGAITCFQHDEFKVLSGSDGTLKMWNIRDGTPVRDLLTGITGVWQVVFEGRWCVAASNRNDTTVLDVWDFGKDQDDDWVGEPPGWMYDDEAYSGDDEDEELQDEDEDADIDEEDIMAMSRNRGQSDEDQEQADVDAMDEDLLPSDTESVMDQDRHGDDAEEELIDELGNLRTSTRQASVPSTISAASSSRSVHGGASSSGTLGSSRHSINGSSSASRGDRQLAGALLRRHIMQGTSSQDTSMPRRPLPSNDETPTRPRHNRNGASRRR
jgi:F-box and WD-40 domain protein CDC4